MNTPEQIKPRQQRRTLDMKMATSLRRRPNLRNYRITRRAQEEALGQHMLDAGLIEYYSHE